MAKPEPKYEGDPRQKLEAWLKHNMPRWRLQGQDIIFDSKDGPIKIGHAKSGIWTDHNQPGIILELTDLNYYMVALTNKGKLVKDLDLDVSIIHIG